MSKDMTYPFDERSSSASFAAPCFARLPRQSAELIWGRMTFCRGVARRSVARNKIAVGSATTGLTGRQFQLDLLQCVSLLLTHSVSYCGAATCPELGVERTPSPTVSRSEE